MKRAMKLRVVAGLVALIAVVVTLFAIATVVVVVMLPLVLELVLALSLEAVGAVVVVIVRSASGVTLPNAPASKIFPSACTAMAWTVLLAFG